MEGAGARGAGGGAGEELGGVVSWWVVEMGWGMLTSIWGGM